MPWPPENVWATWSKSFEGLSSGMHTVRIRAEDSRGHRQPESLPSDARGRDLQYKRYFPQVRLSFEVT